MKINISANKQELGEKAAATGSDLIRNALLKKGHANIILATGASQFEMLEALINETIDWARVTGFHLDEYIDIPLSHPASFRKYLEERFVSRVDIGQFNFIDGQAEPAGECLRLSQLIANHPIDVAFIGIGENGHLAFNDPPADFETEAAFCVVNLDEACRKQQQGEGWFETLDDVPTRAISMSIRQIMKSENIICTVPDLRKAVAVKATLGKNITPEVPASILQQHKRVHLFLDRESASLL